MTGEVDEGTWNALEKAKEDSEKTGEDEAAMEHHENFEVEEEEATHNADILVEKGDEETGGSDPSVVPALEEERELEDKREAESPVEDEAKLADEDEIAKLLLGGLNV